MRKELPNSYACHSDGSVEVVSRTQEGATINYEIASSDLVLDIVYTDPQGAKKNGRVFLRPVTANVLRVNTILPNDLRLFYLAALNCYSGVSDEELVARASSEPREKIGEFLQENVIETKHWSVIEHRGPSFLISGVSRAFSHQLVRHRLPTYSQQSQRYLDLAASQRLDKGEVIFPFIIPPSIRSNPEMVSEFIEGIKTVLSAYYSLRFAGAFPEDARFLLPNAAATRIVVSANRRVWMEIIPKRTCARAQWEIDMVITEVARQLWEEMPEIFANVGPVCSHAKCDQGKRSCGHPLRGPLSEFFGNPVYPHDALIFGMK